MTLRTSPGGCADMLINTLVEGNGSGALAVAGAISQAAVMARLPLLCVLDICGHVKHWNSKTSGASRSLSHPTVGRVQVP